MLGNVSCAFTTFNKIRCRHGFLDIFMRDMCGTIMILFNESFQKVPQNP